MKLYGIPNCDTVKKARKTLDADCINYEFIDLKTVTLDAEQIDTWLTQFPDKIANKRSTTYRNHKDEWLACESQAEQVAFLIANQTMIKRPVIEHDDGSVSIGWPV